MKGGSPDVLLLLEFSSHFKLCICCMSVYRYVLMHAGTHGGQRSRLVVGLEVQVVVSRLSECWEPSWGLLKEQRVLFTAESFLQPVDRRTNKEKPPNV